MVVIAIDEQTHKVTASITDGAITKAKLETEVQTALNKAHEHANKALLDTYDQTNANIKDAVSKKDLLAMILSAMLVILPVAILILFVIAFGCYFLFFH